MKCTRPRSPNGHSGLEVRVVGVGSYACCRRSPPLPPRLSRSTALFSAARSGHRDILNQESVTLIIPTAAIGNPDAALRDMPKAEEVA
jgi:hypothetical protein